MENIVNQFRKLVRPLISIGLIVTTIALALTGKIEPREIVLLTGMVMAFHFGERAALKKTGSDQ